MKKIQNIIKKDNKIIFKISFINNFYSFGNIFVNNGLKHFVLGSLNAEFFYLPCYSKEKIHCKVFYKVEAFM